MVIIINPPTQALKIIIIMVDLDYKIVKLSFLYIFCIYGGVSIDEAGSALSTIRLALNPSH